MENRRTFALSLSTARREFAACESRAQYESFYGPAAFRVWLRTWFHKRFEETFDRHQRHWGTRLSVTQTHQLVRTWIAASMAAHMASGSICPFDVSGDDILRLPVPLERDFDCIPIVYGILTGEYWRDGVRRCVVDARRLRGVPEKTDAPQSETSQR